MIITGTIILILVLLIAFVMIGEDDERGYSRGILLFATAIATLLILKGHCDRPSALDVYRGRTTLEVTYKEGVALDSTVIFKNVK